MNMMLNNSHGIPEALLNGFHIYILSESPYICHASESLACMLGVTAGELASNERDAYASFVHPADLEHYLAHLKRLMSPGARSRADYRLVAKDGSVIYVRDEAVSKETDDGYLVGYSALTDITEMKTENEDLRFLSETMPFGFLRYTCEKQPRITYVNEKMIELLRFPRVRDGELDYLEMYKENIFLMIPMEERRRFAKYLNRVYSAEAPIAGEMTLLRCDGTRAHVFGWVTKCTCEDGSEEFQSVCMDITERHRARQDVETARYIRALCDVYDTIFEFNTGSGTVKCLHCGENSVFKHFENIAMQTEDALERWIIGALESDERPRLRAFFSDYLLRRTASADSKPPQITYSARSGNGEMNKYIGLFIKIDGAVSFYCCRRVHDDGEAEQLKSENDQLKENMRELVARFSDGLAAFEVTSSGMVKPLYASENVSEFFGFTKEEWLPLTEKYTPLESFIEHSEADGEDFARLLRSGEAEFTYFDYKTETERRIKAVCSEKEPSGKSPRYVMLYSVDESAEPDGRAAENTVSIRTFGYFDVFVGDRPIAFRNKKSKELFALLVDRRGGYISSEDAISFLWEDEPVNTVTLSRYRKVALRLKNTLEEYGIADIIEAVDGKRRIIPEAVSCDLYDYLSGKAEYTRLFKGSYLTNYSWGENTLGELVGMMKNE